MSGASWWVAGDRSVLLEVNSCRLFSYFFLFLHILDHVEILEKEEKNRKNPPPPDFCKNQIKRNLDSTTYLLFFDCNTVAEKDPVVAVAADMREVGVA